MSMCFGTVVVRGPGADALSGITTSAQGPGDLDRLRAQHRAYVDLLRDASEELVELPPLAGCPDAYFVEDVAVVLPEIAILTRPGAAARRAEVDAMEPVLAARREIARLEDPATLDGGDVMVVGSEIFVGRSARTNQAGYEQFAALVKRHGYRCTAVEVTHSLHLKSGAAHLGDGLLLLAPSYAASPAFADHPRMVAPPAEVYACNCLRLGDEILLPDGFPATRELLAAHGLRTAVLAVDQVERMDGGLTCMSLRM